MTEFAFLLCGPCTAPREEPMALMDLIPPTPTPAAERPPGITCEKFLRSEGRRCAHYLASGACALASEFMCVEWLKLNGPDTHRLTNPERRERPPRRS